MVLNSLSSLLFNTRHAVCAMSMGLLKAALATGDEELGSDLARTMACNNHDDEQFLADIKGAFSAAGAEDKVSDFVDGAIKEFSIIDAQGVQLASEGNFDEALELFEAAAKRVPSNKSFNLNAVQVLLMMMKKNGASETLMDKAHFYLGRVKSAGKEDKRYAQLLRAYRALE